MVEFLRAPSDAQVPAEPSSVKISDPSDANLRTADAHEITEQTGSRCPFFVWCGSEVAVVVRKRVLGWSPSHQVARWSQLAPTLPPFSLNPPVGVASLWFSSVSTLLSWRFLVEKYSGLVLEQLNPSGISSKAELWFSPRDTCVLSVRFTRCNPPSSSTLDSSQ